MTDISNIIGSFLNYLRSEKRYSEHTLLSYQNDLNQFQDFLSVTFSISNTSDASYGMIRSWISFLSENQYSSRTINRKLACLRSFFKFLIKKGLLVKNPMEKVKAPKIRKSLPVFVPEQEMNHILDNFVFPEGFSGVRDRLVLELLYGTGMRRAELLELKNHSINPGTGTLKVLGKGNKERIIPLNKSLVELIKLYSEVRSREIPIETESFIITDEGKKAYPMFINRVVYKYLKTVAADKKSPHVLRHTFATHLLDKGADLNAIKDLLGHSSLAATQVYTHNSLEKLKNIFDQAHPKA